MSSNTPNQEQPKDDNTYQIGTFLHDPRKIPCFRNSIVWGFGGGAVGFVSGLVYQRTLKRIDKWFAAGFFITAALRWPICRSEYNTKRAQIRVAAEEMAKAEKRSAEKSTSTNQK